ncbi:MAG: phosphate ABC transporter substrate-binding protein [Planctomycetes bacterium]|nr:phosphate ABC transporter substrate-binding protein [Planctomycetota bacterium]
MKITTLLASAALLVAITACGKKETPGTTGTTPPAEQGKGRALQIKGSDTMLEVAQAWAETYRTVKPGVKISVGGGGSGGGIAGIINGTVDIATSSRKFTAEETAEAKKHGHDPVEFHVGYDGIAIFVHKDNPIQSISLEQLAQIYGDGGSISKWSDLGVTLPGGGDKIVMVSRQNNSGTYEYFKEAVLHKQNFKMGTLDQNGSKDVVDQVSKTKASIGYSGLSYGKGADVKMVPVIAKAGTAPVPPSIATVLDKTYPISRPLLMYTSGQPQDEAKAYLEWIVSDAGQHVLLELGYPPLRTL